jgi:hypothetical protein
MTEIIDFWLASPRLNKTKYLEKHFGGKWKYDGMASWWCDDGKRHVSRTASCYCDDKCNHLPHYYLYEDTEASIITWQV